ncbi:SBBP repeat-containing protein [Emticicia sp. C21]|uniref:SBBP repeat-containing protein n=1 Tax=Emticicia sp. C21 TaxID=2302915 RepID=UPI000E345CC4|nr:SBBP repeat-containing protein [Emticicia sp. C21]RFS17808.1 hypothetical protein D0T08_00745 [Emticicia sp. C21]
MKINTLKSLPDYIAGLKRLCLMVAILMATFTTYAQNVTILPSGITPLPAGALPRLSYDAILALPSPTTGDMAVDLTFKCLRFYTGDRWARLINDDDINLPAITAWAEGGTGNDYGYGVATDNNGNIYVAGRFTGTATFESTSIVTTGGEDIFLAKYNRAGALQWVRKAGGSSDDRANAVAVDASGNAYITGRFTGTATFGATNLVGAGQQDVFIAKYNTSGTLQWVKNAGSPGYDTGRGICLSNNGSGVFVTGSFTNVATFGDTTVTSQGNGDIFIAGCSSEGENWWVQTGGSPMDDEGYAIAVDNLNIYATGYYRGNLVFSEGGLTNNGGSSDMFVVKYNADKVFQWAKKGSGPITEEGHGIVASSTGDVFVTGNFAGTANFSGTDLTVYGAADAFLVKYNTDGDMQWVKQLGGTGLDIGYGLTRDANNNVYVTGSFESTGNFGGVSLTSNGDTDVFVAKFTSDGAVQWAQKAGGAGADVSQAVAIDNAANLYLTGYFSGSATFGNTIITSAGGIDVFIARMKE